MYIIENKGGAIAAILVALFVGGSWGSLMLFLERRGRLPQHIALDFSLGNVFAAVLIAFTLGQIGDSTIQDNWPSVLFAMTAGLILCVGNVIGPYAWAFLGYSLGSMMMCSMTVVIGTVTNYFLDGKINRAEILFPGVGCFLIAIFLGAALHSSIAKDKEEKLRMLEGNSITKRRNIDLENCGAITDKHTALSKGDEDQCNAAIQAKPGTAEFILQVETRRSIKVIGSSRLLGLGLAFFAGMCFSINAPLFNIATNDQLHVLKNGVPHLMVYTSLFYFFSSGSLLATCINVWFLYQPRVGVQASTIGAYLKDWNGRHWALLAGVLCGFSNGLTFMGGESAGFATSDAVLALPLICTIWDILLFGEYRKSSRKTYVLLGAMLTMFIIAISVLLASAGHRKNV